MKPKPLSPIFANAAAVLALILTLASGASAAPKFKVLHAFGAGKDGGGLYSGLALDREGNLYGATSGGGTHGQGIVFKLTPGSVGRWSETVLHNFPSSPDDGQGPVGGLIVNAAGDLYGTTEGGGGPYKYGTVFELKPDSGGWKETVLHRFGFNKYGCCSQASLVMDNAGSLFGTAHVAFELSPGGNGWKETLLHTFTGQHGDGYGPYAGVILDASGNVYGTTEMGGNPRCGGGCGTVYELQPTSGGWKEHILHDFGAIGDGAVPGVGALILDSAGNLYGTTGGGGATGYGTVFKLTPQADGHWKETILHNFTGSAQGVQPAAGVVMDRAGNFYGTTTAGGDPNCGCGVVYKLSPGFNGKWTYTVLHRFTGYDGAGPNANLILDSKGNLYGTTTTGGAGGYGVAFELTP